MDLNTVHLLFFIFSAEFLLLLHNFSAISADFAEKFLCRCGKVGVSAEKCLKNLRNFGKIA